MVTQPGSRSAATTLPRSSGSATPTESSPAGGCPQLTAQQCTQTPQSGVERPDPPICVHSCDPKATHSPSPQFNSVHKRPNLAWRGPILPSVYTPAIPRPPTAQAHSSTVYTNAPIRRREPRSFHLCTLSRPREVARDTIVYTNAPIWRPEALATHLCTLLRPPGAAHSPTVYTNAPNWRGEALATHLCTLSRPPGAAHGSIVYTNAPKIQQKSHREFGTSSHLSCPSKNAAILSNGMASFPPPS